MSHIVVEPPYFSFSAVFDAIQNRIVKAETKYGKIPYRVSLTECECRSIARKTVTQKKTTQSERIIPITVVGIYIHPIFLNQFVLISSCFKVVLF